MAAAKKTAAKKAETKPETTEIAAVETPREFEHRPRTDIKTGERTGHAEMHNVLGRAVAELQARVRELEARLSAEGEPGQAADGDESADTSGDNATK